MRLMYQMCDLDTLYTGVDRGRQECMRLMYQMCDLDTLYTGIHKVDRDV